MKQKSGVIIVAALLMTLVLAGCNIVAASTDTADTRQIPEIIIKTRDYTFEAPAEIEAGLVSITLQNEGQEPHHVQLARLNEGITADQFQTALRDSPESIFSMVSWAGGPAVVDRGGRQTVTVELAAGDYMLLCFVPDGHGVPHVAFGMMAPMRVTENADLHPQPEPQADITLRMLDFSYQLATEVRAGPQVWKVVNAGIQPHEINLVKLADGKTMADVEAFMHAQTGSPPFTDAGGFQGIDGGKRGWIYLDLTPGEYVALCHIPDPASGKAHTELGMIMPFSVK